MKFNEKNFEKRVSKTVRELSAYVPGEQPRGKGWVKLNTNELPYPPSPKVAKAIIKELGKGENLRLYPDPSSLALRTAIAEYFGVMPENTIAGNGSDDILNLAFRAFSDGDLKVATLDPSYSLYPVLSKMQGSELIQIPFKKNLEIDFASLFKSRANIFFFTSPNAPTGRGFDEETLVKILEKFNGIVLVDEAYAPFSGYSASKLIGRYPNLIVSGTSSKGWGLAGMRVGWAIASKEIISTLDKVRDSYNVDRLAQVAGIAAMSDSAYHKKIVNLVVRERENTENFFDEIGWNYPVSSSNFVLVEPKDKSGKSGKEVAGELFEFLKKNKILVRYFPNQECAASRLRITIGTPEQMNALKVAIKKWLK